VNREALKEADDDDQPTVMSRPVAVRAGIDCDAGVKRRRKVAACRTVEFDEHLRKLFERQSLDKRFRASLRH
jgi:hypothetical protein